jgi:hypothetical protein
MCRDDIKAGAKTPGNHVLAVMVDMTLPGIPDDIEDGSRSIISFIGLIPRRALNIASVGAICVDIVFESDVASPAVVRPE